MDYKVAMDAKIVKEDSHELVEIIQEGLHDVQLVSGRCVGQAEWHDNPDVGTPLGDEGRCVLVRCIQLNWVVTDLTIHEWVQLVASNLV